jgi:hypothetical protein
MESNRRNAIQHALAALAEQARHDGALATDDERRRAALLEERDALDRSAAVAARQQRASDLDLEHLRWLDERYERLLACAKRDIVAGGISTFVGVMALILVFAGAVSAAAIIVGVVALVFGLSLLIVGYVNFGRVERQSDAGHLHTARAVAGRRDSQTQAAWLAHMRAEKAKRGRIDVCTGLALLACGTLGMLWANGDPYAPWMYVGGTVVTLLGMVELGHGWLELRSSRTWDGTPAGAQD